LTVYLYAVCDATACAPGCKGLRGEALAMIRAAGLSALTSEAPPSPPHTEEDLWRHEHVVESLMRDHDVLPARFGTILPDESAVRKLLGERAGEFAAALDRVAGSVELGVRAALHAAAEPANARAAGASSGTEYLLDAKRRDRLMVDLTERLDRELAPMAKDAHIRPRRWPIDPVRCAYLVDRARVDSFLQRSSEIAEETDYAELVCTGPWPPYSFVRPHAED
jgi:Gas vesicle synthesis protein GvpL/GvpF